MFTGLEPEILYSMWHLYGSNMKILLLVILKKYCDIVLVLGKMGLGSRKEKKHKTNLIFHMEEFKITKENTFQ